jgi:hypothetical protein
VCVSACVLVFFYVLFVFGFFLFIIFFSPADHCIHTFCTTSLSRTDVVQFFLLPLVLGEGLIPLLLSNTLYAVALSWYWYITHLGYRTLPFLSNTEVFLFPIAVIVLLYIILIIGYPLNFGCNLSRVMARFYFM